jgi:hypothetical protein
MAECHPEVTRVWDGGERRFSSLKAVKGPERVVIRSGVDTAGEMACSELLL